MTDKLALLKTLGELVSEDKEIQEALRAHNKKVEDALAEETKVLKAKLDVHNAKTESFMRDLGFTGTFTLLDVASKIANL